MSRLPLPPCPGAPNCVCSRDDRPAHDIPPFSTFGDAQRAWETLAQVVRGLDRTVIVEHTATYLKAQTRTKWLRFVDDLEFELDERSGCIHCRSESRTGYSDLGVNRRRLEALREDYDQRMTDASPDPSPTRPS